MEIKTPDLFLTCFLKNRHLDRPAAKPLFSYHMTFEEFTELQHVVRRFKPAPSMPDKNLRPWSACFVLWASEWYRREYINENGWQWEPVFEQLGFSLSNTEISELIPWAFETYWKRPIRRYTERRNILGTVFIEGGLPYKLISKGESKFSSIIERALMRYESITYANGSLSDYVAEQSKYLPKVFSEPESVALITDIVETLIIFADKVDLQSEVYPDVQLDKTFPSWRNSFPLPLESKDGREIINSWLSKATEVKVKRKSHGNTLFCKHSVTDDFKKIESHVFLPKYLSIEGVTKENLSSSRLELYLKEGERDSKDLGAGFCKFSDTGIELNVRQRDTRLIRRDAYEALIIAVNSGGVKIHTFEVPESAIMFGTMPVGLVQEENKFQIIGQGSFTTKRKEILLVVPSKAEFQTLSGAVNANRVLDIQEVSCKIITLCGDLRVRVGDQSYRIRTNSTIETSGGLFIKTHTMPYISKPSLVYKDIPEIADSFGLNHDFDTFLGKENVHNLAAYQKTGIHTLSVKNKDGDTLLQRKVGLVPKDFDIFMRSNEDSATLHLCCKSNLLAEVQAKDCDIQTTSESSVKKFKITPQNLPPKDVTLEVFPNLDSDPIYFTLPFPAEGVHAYDQHGQRLKTSTTIEQLMGSQLYLYSSKDFLQTFEIEIALAPISSRSPKAIFKIPVKDRAVVINLYSYKQQILELLSLSEDIDAFIRLTVRLRRDLFVCNIRRFATPVFIDHDHKQISFDHSLLKEADLQQPIALKIAEPEQQAVHFESTVHGMELNYFMIPSKLETGGPWMIVPHPDAQVDFRPNFYMNNDSLNIQSFEETPKSIQGAVKAFHPKTNPDVINVFLEQMSLEMSHRGWGYIKSLWANYGYLPLSTFAVWKALVANEDALIVSLFVLDMDPNFIQKLDTEFPIHWEMFKLSAWRRAIIQYRVFLTSKGISDEIVDSVTYSQVDSLANALPAIPNEVFVSLMLDKKISQVPPQAIEIWLKDLIQSHAESDWPDKHLGVFQEIAELLKKSHPDLTVQTFHKWQLPVATYPIVCAAIACEVINKHDVIRFTPEFNFECKELRSFDLKWFNGVYCYAIAALQAKEGK